MTEEQPKHHKIKASFPFLDVIHFGRLVTELRFLNRFTLDPATEKFVHSIVKYAKAYKTTELPSGAELYRARLHDPYKEEAFKLSDMGAPPKGLAGHGRLNPKGITYLYLSSHEITAISECRPHAGACLTVAKYKTLRCARLVNFSRKLPPVSNEGEEFEGAEWTWKQLIAYMFSAPFDPRDDTAYVPTQYLAERFKRAELDGVIYDSALEANGYNVALFDPAVAEGVSARTATVDRIQVIASIEGIVLPQVQVAESVSAGEQVLRNEGQAD